MARVRSNAGDTKSISCLLSVTVTVATRRTLFKARSQPGSGPREFSDYVLLGKNGKPLAVV